MVLATTRGLTCGGAAQSVEAREFPPPQRGLASRGATHSLRATHSGGAKEVRRRWPLSSSGGGNACSLPATWSLRATHSVEAKRETGSETQGSDEQGGGHPLGTHPLAARQVCSTQGSQLCALATPPILFPLATQSAGSQSLFAHWRSEWLLTGSVPIDRIFAYAPHTSHRVTQHPSQPLTQYTFTVHPLLTHLCPRRDDRIARGLARRQRGAGGGGRGGRGRGGEREGRREGGGG